MAVLTPPSPAAYLRAFAIALAVLFGACIAFSILVDPYYLFDTPLISGFNTPKVRASQQPELAKTALLRHACPRTLVLGNSRFEVAIDPQSAAWPAEAKPVFNAALAGTGPRVALRLLDIALADCRPTRVITNLDFIDSLYVQPKLPEPDWRARATDLLHATATLDALNDSVMTILHLRGADRFLAPDGLNTLLDYPAFVAAKGYRRLFATKRTDYAGQLDYARRQGTPAMRAAVFDIIATTIAHANAAGAAVSLVIPPYHTEYLDLLREQGLADSFADWKRALAAMLAARRQAGADVRLFDFSLPSPQTSEPVPPEADLTVMRNYWELGHFKVALGDAIIARLFADTGFGVELPLP